MTKALDTRTFGCQNFRQQHEGYKSSTRRIALPGPRKHGMHDIPEDCEGKEGYMLLRVFHKSGYWSRVVSDGCLCPLGKWYVSHSEARCSPTVWTGAISSGPDSRGIRRRNTGSDGVKPVLGSTVTQLLNFSYDMTE